ncbi:MAG TPA: PEP-CTERM sorting domain-containing protein [Longimicrobiales bacterium]|nr:PEP-CTERM sorting domain-containing protein [Longimicrobiales bacterium]
MVRRVVLFALLLSALSLMPQHVSASPTCWSITSSNCFDFTGGSWYSSTHTFTWNWGIGDLGSWLDDLIDDILDQLDDYDLSWLENLDWGKHGRNDTPRSVPEPATLMLLGAGLVGVGAASRRRRDDER